MITKIKSSLTLKIFLGTFFILLFACAFTYGFIACVMPRTYSSNLYQELATYTEKMLSGIEDATYDDAEAVMLSFAKENDATITIYDESENIKNVLNGPSDNAVTENENASGSEFLCFSISFADTSETYQIVVQQNQKAVSKVTEVFGKIWYWVLLCILFISALTSFLYARYITKPIVKASHISKKIANMDFNWRYEETRTDEIGVLEHNINLLSDKLEAALSDLKKANEKLQKDIEDERENEEQMRQFFSAVSHELKTPITIIKGQLCGMIDGVGSYADRDKYLVRSLGVANRMEKLVQELLMVARLDQNNTNYDPKQINLSKLVQECVDDYVDLFEQKSQTVTLNIKPNLVTTGDATLLRKTICNILSNAAFYSPEKETITISLREEVSTQYLIVENNGVHIKEESLPHLFDAFYREDASRNRETGGSGLGLYLVKKIMDKHNGTCKIYNTENGVGTELTLSTS